MKWIATRFGLYFAAALLLAPHIHGHAQSPRVIQITASRFAFSPDEITIKKGEEVVLAMQSTDVDHGLLIDELGIRAEIKKGTATEVKLNAPAAGTFEGQCAHFCGTGHGTMRLTVHVVE